MRKSSSISASVNAAVGSSMISTCELKDSALAISTICCLATVKSATLVRGSSFRCIESNKRLRLGVDPIFVQHQADTLAWLTADEDILRQREVGHQVQLLVDHADPQVLRGPRGVDFDLFALIEDAAGIFGIDAGKHLHQSGLACAVFADERMHLTGAQLEFGLIQRMHTGKGFVDPFHQD